MTLLIGQAFEKLFGPDVPLRFTAYDGSSAGRADADVHLHLANERGLRYIATAPGSLGLARAYVQGDLVIEGVDEGDPYELLKLLEDEVVFQRPHARDLPELAKLLGWTGIRPPELPAQETPPQWLRLVNGLRHSRSRDAEAIHHHYDVSNAFYELLLGPSMTYTCACYPTADASLEEAQAEKYDLVCRKLDLRPGMRLLDVGCGWGGMVRHAVKNYGVTALGVTLSEQQAAWGAKTIAEEGLSGAAEVRHSDYRAVRETGFDAVELDRPDRAHRREELPGVLPLPARPAAGRRPAAQPQHHPDRQPSPRYPARRLHQPLRLPRRRAHRLGHPGQRHAGRGAGGAPRGEPA